jgi:prepilin-type N-terminal cleavage/methylation domain-containing protein
MTMQRLTRHAERGFSLVELMVAMVITMIISGAIYGLLSSGQSAFRREPELTDRQQNIRSAMNMIQKDILNAGMLGSDKSQVNDVFMQTFWRQDQSPQDTSTTCLLDGRGPQGIATGQNSDVLQFLMKPDDCPSVSIDGCGGGVVLNLADIAPACYGLQPDGGLVLIVGDTVNWGLAEQPGGGGGGCAADLINFPPGQAPAYNAPGGNNIPNSPRYIVPIQIVRYEIQIDAQGVPNLMRSTSGLGPTVDNRGIGPVYNAQAGPDFLRDLWNAITPMGVAHAGPAGGGGCTTGTPSYELVARGIEDMQVQYRMGGSTTWLDSPAVVTLNDYNTIVREVRVTLSARVVTPNLTTAGAAATTSAITSGAGISTGGRAVRGSLTSVTTPRAAIWGLGQAATGSPNPQPTPWN